VLGQTGSFSTGGLGYTSLGAGWTEVFQGQALPVARAGVFLRRSPLGDLVVEYR